MSHIPIAFLLLGALAPLYTLAVIWDRREENSRMRRLRRPNRAHGESLETNEPQLESSCSVQQLELAFDSNSGE